MASFYPAEVYNSIKLTCTPLGGNHISDIVSTLLLHMQFKFIWSPTIAGLFKTACFSFTKGFHPVSPCDQFRNQWINDRFYLSCIKLNPGVLRSVSLIKLPEEFKSTVHIFLYTNLPIKHH